MTEVNQTTNEIVVSGIDTTVSVTPTAAGPNVTVNTGISNIDITPSAIASEVSVGYSAIERGYYGAFSDYTDQLPGVYDTGASAIDTPAAFVFGQVDESNGVSIVNNEYNKLTRITVAHSGTYNIQWSGQFQNTDSQDHDIYVWMRKNGSIATGSSSDIVGSTGLVAIPSKHGAVNGHIIVGWNFVMTLNSGDYVEFFWSADSTLITVQHYDAGASPTRPSTASLVLTVTQVGNILEGGVSGGGGGSGAQGPQGPQGATGAQGPQGPQGPQGATGTQGPQGPSGVIAVTAPITNSGTSTSANIGLGIGTGLTTSGGLLVPDFGSTSGKVTQGDDSRLDAHTKLSATAPTTPIVSTTAKTAFITQSIGPVTTGDVYMLTAFGDLLQQTGAAATYTFELVLGSTTLGTSNAISLVSSGTRRKWHMELHLVCDTTSSQSIGGLFVVGALSGAVTMPLTAPNSMAPLTYTATENMATAKNLVWSVTMSVNSASMDFRTLGFTLRRLR